MTVQTSTRCILRATVATTRGVKDTTSLLNSARYLNPARIDIWRRGGSQYSDQPVLLDRALALRESILPQCVSTSFERYPIPVPILIDIDIA